MDDNITVLANIPVKKKAKIISIHPRHHGGYHRGHHKGHNFNRRMCAMGIREGQIVEVLSKQPFFGPLTIKAGNCSFTIGRGMANKIIVEKI